MNRRERRAAERAAKKAERAKRHLPISRDDAFERCFHGQRRATSDILEEGLAIEKVLEVAENARGFGEAIAGKMDGDRGRYECRKGCAFCCYLAVRASAPEVFEIAQSLRGLAEAELRTLQVHLASIDEQTRGMPTGERFRSRIPCAFLGEDGACSIYGLRPLACRGWNSFERASCEKAYVEGSAESAIAVGEIPMKVFANVSAGVLAGSEDRGLDGRPLKLMSAVRAALEDPSLAGRWLAGERLPDELVERETAEGLAQLDLGTLEESVAVTEGRRPGES